jgi:polysaccharide pyruvyl transferase WcaK-like protein
MRVLIDQSGYDLLNLGDVAMLQGCVARLRQQWPTAEILVIAHAPDRLRRYCPDTTAILPTFADLRGLKIFPRKARYASEQLWKIAGPPLHGRLGRGEPRDAVPETWPRTAIQAVHWADAVVASGGGYLTDTWWWHAAGVLSVLALAQSLGKPTAMFGQGFGPLRGRALCTMASWVLPRLTALGLREEITGLGLALSCGVGPDVITITGDEAIEVIPDTAPAVSGGALGFNIRAADYSGIGRDAAAAIGTCVVGVAHELRAPIVGLPVSRYATTSDLAVIGECLERGHTSRQVALADLSSPAELKSASAQCRAVVTGSYHAAVYALAQGVPAVCLSKSRYYDAKFAGLSALFPEACQVVSLIDHDPARPLRRAILRGWQLPAAARSAARDAAARQRASGRSAYEGFRLSMDPVRELATPVSLRRAH